MIHMKASKYLVMLAVVLVLLAAPVYAPLNFAAHPTEIDANGTLTLNRGSDSYDVPIDVTFLAIVSNTIPRAEYNDVGFEGFAMVPIGSMIKFDGILTVDDANIWVRFDAAKPETPEIPEGRYSAHGTLDVNITDVVIPPAEITWALMKGRITKFGDTDAFGGIKAHVKISEDNNFTRADAFFTLKPPEEEETPGMRSNTFYIVNLISVVKTELNTGGRNLYIEGNWSVYNRTCTVNVQDDVEAEVAITITPVVENVTGQLSVVLPGFNLTIPALMAKLGADRISGDVTFFHFMFAMPFGHGIPMSDFNKDRMINIQDIANMGRAFGAKLGSHRYNFDLDVNSDFAINILDVVKAGQEFGEEY